MKLSIWDADVVLLVDFLQHGSTISGEYEASLLEQPRAMITGKKRGKMSKGVRLLQDNAPAHKSRIAVNN